MTRGRLSAAALWEAVQVFSMLSFGTITCRPILAHSVARLALRMISTTLGRLSDSALFPVMGNLTLYYGITVRLSILAAYQVETTAKRDQSIKMGRSWASAAPPVERITQRSGRMA